MLTTTKNIHFKFTLFTDGIWGNSHYYRLFQTQLLDIQNSGNTKTLASEGVPDISDNGSWMVGIIAAVPGFQEFNKHQKY